MYWLIPWCVLALGLGLLPDQARAQVTLEARLGFQGAMRLGKWNVVTVHLHNAGGPLTGTLSVRTWLGSEARGDLHTTTLTRAIELPPGARKRLTFSVPITSIADPVEIALRQGAQIIAQQRLDLREALHAEQVIIGLTRDISLDFLATVFPTTHTRVVYLSPSDAPQQWSGYDSVSAMVLKGISLQALSEEQMTTLRQWLANGGTLVVAGDSQYTLLTESRLRALLPVEVLGLQHLEALPALAARYSSPVPEVPLAMIRSRLRQGQVLIGTADAPLLAQRAFGKGRVVFLAVDYAMRPLAGWPGTAALWQDILQPSEHPEYGHVSAELGLMDEAHPVMKLLGRPVLAFPSHLTLSGLLLAYCSGLGLLFWRLNHRRVRHWRYWGGIGGLTLAFAGYAASPLLALDLDQSALIFDVTTVDNLPGTDYAHVLGYVGLFAIRPGQFALTFQHPATIVRHTFTRGTGKVGKDVEVQQASPPGLRHLVMDSWALRVFSTESVTSTPIQVTTQPQGAGLTVQVENRGALTLQGATVVYKGKLFSLGPVGPGESVLDHLYPALYNAEYAQETTWRVLLKRRPAEHDVRLAYAQEVLLQQYFGDKRLAEASETPFLAGWLMAPSTLSQQAAPTPVRGVTLLVSRFALEDSVPLR